MAANLNLATAFVQLSLKGASAVIAGMNSIRKNITTSLAPLSDNFKQMEASVMGFVSAASPQAIRTFQGSAMLLSATIGTALIPQIIIVSGWIQNLAEYIRNMNPETKAQIANWVGYTVAISGAVYAFSKLNSIFSLIVANPVAATFLAVSAAVLKVNADMDQMIGKMNDAVEVMERMKKGKYTEGEYKGSAAGAIETGEGSAEDKLKKAMEVRERLTREVKAQAKEEINQGALVHTKDYLLGKMGFQDQTAEAQDTIQQKLKEAGMLDDLISRLRDKKGGPQFTSKEELQKGRNGLALAGAGVGGGGGGTTSLENAFIQNAQASLAADDIQQKILQQQMEGNQIAQRAAAATERTADALDRASHP